MANIDQEKLCEYCECTFEIKRDRCEGCRCEEAEERYLEEYGIEIGEDSLPSSFEKLKVNDRVYYLARKTIPEIINLVVSGVTMDTPKTIGVSFTLNGYGREFGESRKKRSFKNYFILESEAKAELKKECLNRIVELSKVIGSVSV